MKKALITGITGQDGAYLSEFLLKKGYEVHGTKRRSSSFNTQRIDHLYQDPHVENKRFILHYGDLTDTSNLVRIIQQVQPDEIYNLGGISSVAFSWDHPVLTGKVSGLGAVAIMAEALQLQEALGRPVRVLQASSSEIFGDPSETPQKETTAIRPRNPYGAAKAYAHLSATAFRERGLPVSTVILFNHESPRRPETFVTRKITAGFARIAHEGGGTLALGNLDAQRDWGWAPDYVEAMVRAIRHDPADDFVIATGVTHSVADFVTTAAEHAGIANWREHVDIDPQFVRPFDAAIQVGDASKARELLGWSPTVAFDQLVARMVAADLTALDAATGTSHLTTSA